MKLTDVDSLFEDHAPTPADIQKHLLKAYK